MVTRDIIEIDEDKCTGCGICITSCHEGALALVDGKAKLTNDIYCDGLGNCLKECPEDAITITKKDVKEFDFKATNEHLKELGREELKNNPLEEPKMKDDLPCGCPGTQMRELKPTTSSNQSQESQLQQWPVQLNLLPPQAPFFENSHLLVAADCVPFAHANFHSKLLQGKSLVIGCPKLDDIDAYQEKLTAIFQMNKVKSVTIAIMEVPCCEGMHHAVKQAIEASGEDIPLIKEVITVDGKLA